MKFLTSGVLKFTNLGCFQNGIDVFCVGGGGAGSSPERPGGASGGGGTGNYPCSAGSGSSGVIIIRNHRS